MSFNNIIMIFVWVVFLLSLATQFDQGHADIFRIDCGSPRNTIIGNRIFMNDSFSANFLITPYKLIANTSTKTDLQLYKTARFFKGTTIYKFPINHMGRYIIRLYFSPFSYHNYNISSFKFSLSSQQFVLLKDFSPKPNTMKEFFINVDSKFFDITIEPSSNFIGLLNALEVFPIPNVLFQDDAIVINTKKTFQTFFNRALETIVRVNMGGPTINYDNDSLWRTWKSADNFLEHNRFVRNVQRLSAVHYRSGLAIRDAAPITVYGTCTKLNTWNDDRANFRATWQFDVDVGFQYLLRFHYCDIVSSSTNELYFNVFVDSWVVSKMLDLTTLAKGVLGAPLYLDFVTPVTTGNKFNVSIGIPAAHTNNPHAILNGLEILKISDDENNLDEGVPHPHTKQNSKNNRLGVIIRSVTVVIVGLVLVSVAIWFFVYWRSNVFTEGHPTSSSTTANINATAAASTVTADATNVGRRIPLEIIRAATNDFDDGLAIGQGGFGKVYKGVFDDETRVAIKRGYVRTHHDQTSFRTEIELLSQCRHRHLVSLIGYCDENNENILVYEYMENGTLQSHLYDSRSCMSWKQRLVICIGAAKGIQTLHNDYPTVVIHRDVKSSNILLDENFMAKVADFGLSKATSTLSQDHITTIVKGSIGYIDPEYFRTQRITTKSDVYSFGVVLFEVLCGRPVVNTDLPEKKKNLVRWALNKKKKGKLDSIIDPKLRGDIKAGSLWIYGELAEKCVNDDFNERPSINYVVWNLEYCLRLQEDADHSDTQQQPSTSRRDDVTEEETSTSVQCPTITDEDLPSGSMETVFSEMLHIEPQ